MDTHQQARLDILGSSIDSYRRDPHHRESDLLNALEMIRAILDAELRSVGDKKL